VAYLRVVEGGTLFPKDRCVVSFDGTHIAYTFLGRERAGRPTVALCAGYCCPDNFWRYLAPALARRWRVLVWNYRGSGVSGLPREPGYRARNYTVEDFALDRYARDLKEILDHEGIGEVVLVGHSMGVQVCLEAYRLMPERVRAIVSITGPYASPLRTFYNSTLLPRVFPVARLAIQLFPRPLLVLWRALFRSGLPHPAAIRIGALGPRAKAEDMRPYYDHMAELDPLVMMKMAEAMHRHSAEDLLRRIEPPTLVIVGDRDNFTPAWLGRVMASRIPRAELVVVPGGTHGAIIEEPRLVNRAVLDFLARHLEVAAARPVRRSDRVAPPRR
jgi:pimeloyl-ACP methyl ester carboxylesterase